jgi:pimeloyl-ACP methyl ester carboxylesterase
MRVTRRGGATVLAALAVALQAEFPRAELMVLDGCGHVPMADCPEVFDRAVVPFLQAAR